ncbi:hypothetical protein HBI80_190990 [Parastagonospora nodorum]|nr:hypothetical protein HBI80_190990 [Parastagonospora nodorum]KAH5250815.1 hypothetical protein HBI71_161980 [Parastagonospora nodorum]
MYGEPFECLEKSEMHPWVALIFDAMRTGEMIVFFKRYSITRVLLNILIGKKMAAARADHKALTKERTDRRVALGAEGNGKKDFMWYILKNNTDKGGMSDMEIKMNSESLIVAGSETTATCLSATAHLLGKNPEIMKTVLEEVRPRYTSEDQITIKTTTDLIYMQACIEESLRMFPPAVVSPTRLSPGDFVGGYYIPKNTKVHLHQHASYRSPGNWHRPDDYRPERFLPKDHPLYDASFAKDNKKSFNPFSFGPANCIGKNLAYAELRLIMARLLWRFDLLPQPGSEAWMDGMRAYTLWDKPPLMMKFANAEH